MEVKMSIEWIILVSAINIFIKNTGIKRKKGQREMPSIIYYKRT